MKKIFALLLMSAAVPAFCQNVTITDDSTHTADPSAVLDVHSATKGFLIPRLSSAGIQGISQPATGLLIYQTDGTEGFYYNKGTPASPSWEMLSGSSSSLWIKGPLGSTTLLGSQADSVGIGTPWPEEKLDVTGNLVLDNFMPMILFKEDSMQAARIMHFGPPNNGYLHLQAWDGNNFENTGLVVKSPGQEVGVGTTAPVYRLDVAGTARMNGFILSSPTDSGYVLTSDENGLGTWKHMPQHVSGTGTPDYIPKFSSADTLANSTLYQDSQGRIGIGMNLPAERLQVNGNVKATQFIGNGSQLTGIPGDNLGNHTATSNIRSNGHWLSSDGGNEGIFINNDGKVGAGINSVLNSLFTSNGMIESRSEGYRFPDGTVQMSAAASSMPDVGTPRLEIGLECSNFPGSWGVQYCPYCSAVFDVKWYSSRPWNENSGLPSGDRRYKALTVIKDVDLATVKYIEYFNLNQQMNELILHYYWIEPPQGQIVEYYRIRLQDVWIVAFNTRVMEVDGGYAHLDEISIIAEDIRWEYLPAGLEFNIQWIFPHLDN
ncbi:MAG: type VI secretion system tube protein Hcp [Bacteroidales bacterium]|nr:type VI secretion system tube protein Hcp [Bacteroidales bacterium]